MNKLFNKIATLSVGLAMAIGVGVAIGSGKAARSVKADSYTITFSTGSGDGTSASTSTACSDIVSDGSAHLSGNLVTATKVYYSGSSGLKLGASSSAGIIKMNLATPITPTSVVVNAKLYNSGKSATLKVNSSATQSITADFSNLTFNPSGEITYLELESSKYCWIASITVNYSGGATYHDLTYAVGTQGVYDGSTTKQFSVAESGTHTVLKPEDVGISANTGYIFTSWNDGTTDYNPDSTYTMGTSDVTLTAQWVAGVGLSYNPVSDSGTGTGTMDTTYVVSGGTQTVAACTFTAPSGMKFDHWNTSASDNGTDYDPEDTITNYSSAITLYAIWVEDNDITFTAGVDTGDTSVTKDNVTISMSTMSRSDNYRVYSGTNLVASITSGNITKIELTCTGSGTNDYGPGKFSGTGYTYSGNIGTWAGESNSVTLVASAQVRITKIVVSVSGGGTITAASTTVNTTDFSLMETATGSISSILSATVYGSDGTTPATNQAVIWSAQTANVITLDNTNDEYEIVGEAGDTTRIYATSVDGSHTSENYVTLTITEYFAAYVIEFGNDKNTNPTELDTVAKFEAAYDVPSGVTIESLYKVFGVASSWLKCGSNKADMQIILSIPSSQYISAVIIEVAEGNNLDLDVSGQYEESEVETQNITSAGTYTFDDYLPTEKDNKVYIETNSNGAFYLKSITLVYEEQEPEITITPNSIDLTANTTSSSVTVSADYFTPTSYNAVVKSGSSLAASAISWTGNTFTVTAGSSTGTTVFTITASDTSSHSASADFTVNVVGARSLTDVSVTTNPTKTTYLEGDTLDLTGVVVTATYSDSSTTVFSAAVGNLDLLTFDPNDGDTLSTSDETVTVYITAEGDTIFGGFDITVTEKTIIPYVTDAKELYDGQQVYIGNSSDKAWPAYSSGNNIQAVSAEIDGGFLCTDTTTAIPYTIGRVSPNGTDIYYSFSYEVSGTVYYLKDNGTTNANKITASTTRDDACLWSISIDDTTGQCNIVNKSNEDKPYLRINGQYLACYTDSQTKPTLYVVNEYKAKDVAFNFEVDQLHLLDYDEDLGYCSDSEHAYYEKAKEVWNAMSEDEKIEVSSEGIDRLAAWAAANGDTLDSNLDLVRSQRISILSNIDITKNNGAALIIVIVSVLSVTAVGGYFLLKKKKTK